MLPAFLFVCRGCGVLTCEHWTSMTMGVSATVLIALVWEIRERSIRSIAVPPLIELVEKEDSRVA
jgi:hypothetical protein